MDSTIIKQKVINVIKDYIVNYLDNCLTIKDRNALIEYIEEAFKLCGIRIRISIARDSRFESYIDKKEFE